MRATEVICFIVVAMLSAAATQADEVQVVSDLLEPEGPLYIDGNLYYVGWVSNNNNGKKFDGGINDIVVTANGGAYATVFGPYADPPIPTFVIGKILYLAPGSEQWVEVANHLNYANGIGVSPDQKSLYVSETVGNCILKFTINGDGSLSHRSNFAVLNLLTKNKNDSWWLGPDSKKIDSKVTSMLPSGLAGRC
jgi:hypothetical protein